MIYVGNLHQNIANNMHVLLIWLRRATGNCRVDMGTQIYVRDTFTTSCIFGYERVIHTIVLEVQSVSNTLQNQISRHESDKRTWNSLYNLEPTNQPTIFGVSGLCLGQGEE